MEEYLKLYKEQVREFFADDFKSVFEMAHQSLCGSVTLFTAGVTTLFDLQLWEPEQLVAALLGLIAQPRSEEMVFGFNALSAILKRAFHSEPKTEFEELQKTVSRVSSQFEELAEGKFQRALMDCAMDNNWPSKRH